MRGGVLQLHRWGLLDRIVDAGTPPIRRTTFRYADDDVTVTIKPSHGVDALYAPRRTVLDPILVDAAVAAGADVRYGVTVTDVRRDADGRVIGIDGRDDGGRPVAVDADLVIGADGLRSTVAQRVGAPIEHARHRRGRRRLRLLVRRRDRRLRVDLPARGRRRSDPHQRRPHLRVRRQHPGPDRPWRTGGARSRRPPSRRRASPTGSTPGPRRRRAHLRRPPRLPPAGVRTRVGARRRRRLLEGPDQRPRPHRRPPRRRAARPSRRGERDR